jgi:DNA-binding response OmpR family regulator
LLKLLIIDDERSMTSVLKTLLELEDFEVEVCATGAQGIEAAQKHPPHAVMVDYHLSDMTGLDIIKALRQTPHLENLPIALASGMDKEKEALAGGADLFIMKPFEPSQLGDIMRRLIQG